MPDLRISDLTGQTGAGLIDADLFVAARANSDNYRLTRTEMVAGLVGRTTFSDAAKTVDAADRYVAQTGTMSATRIVTLASAANVPAGAQVVIADESGTVSASNTLEIKAPNPQTIDGVVSSTNYPIIRFPYGSMTFRSNGSNWFLIDRKPAIDVQVFTTTGSNTWRKPFGCSRVRLIMIAGGGGGGSGSASGTNSIGGAGGQAGGLTFVDSITFADLSATETVTVGTAGTAGVGSGTSAAAGGAGGDTWFSASTKWVAQGGAGGGGASTSATSSAGAGSVTGAAGGAGGNGADGTGGTAGLSSATGGTVTVAPGGGGGGGGFLSPSAQKQGGNGGNSSLGVGTSSGGLSGGASNLVANGAAGTSSSSITSTFICGGGGGGGGTGGSNLFTTSGGAGGSYGGGGGGGGGDTIAWGSPPRSEGRGAAGGQGVAIVEAY